MTSIQLIPFLLLALAFAAGLWQPQRPVYGLTLALATLLLALPAGQVDAGRGLPIGFAGLLLVMLAQRLPRWRPVLLLVLGIGGFLLATHKLPGFQQLAIAPSTQIGSASVPYALNWSFDKGFAGLLLLLAWPPSADQPRLSLHQGLWLALPAAGLPLLLGWAGGLVGPDVKLHPLLPAFLFGNLLLTVIPEQIFFHGLIGRALASRLRPVWWIAPVVGLLFAAVHSGPPPYLALVMLSGTLHALLYLASRRLEPGIAAHWSMNAGHFVLLTYPR